MAIKLNDPGLLKQQAFLNGQWVDADQGDSFEVINPATGESISRVASMGADETRRAIDAASAAMALWQKQPAKERAAVLQKWYQLILSNLDDLELILTMEQGKVLNEARGEVTYGASFVEWFAEEAKRINGDILPATNLNQRALVIKQPVGVVAAITPWNFPNAMITRKVAPALAAGCAIVLKPSEQTPLSALALAELAQRAGLPAGLFSVLPSAKAREVGTEMTENPLVRKISFTGSTAVGKTLMQQSAKTVKRTSMELGGNAPVIIFDDADLDKAVAGALASKYRNAGQTCICANRILVQESIYSQFLKRFKAAVNRCRMGNGLEEGNTIGPVINRDAIKSIQALVDDAVAKGAEVVTGGLPDDAAGCFYPPTVLANIDQSMEVYREEIFGPVAPVIAFSSEEEAIAIANDTDYGLASYIYTRDLGRIWRVSEAIEFGMIGVNETAISSELIPFGGIKQSGQGREGSKYGIDDYIEIKYICLGGLDS